jgi:hypothetical protein
MTFPVRKAYGKGSPPPARKAWAGSMCGDADSSERGAGAGAHEQCRASRMAPLTQRLPVGAVPLSTSKKGRYLPISSFDSKRYRNPRYKTPRSVKDERCTFARLFPRSTAPRHAFPVKPEEASSSPASLAHGQLSIIGVPGIRHLTSDAQGCCVLLGRPTAERPALAANLRASRA